MSEEPVLPGHPDAAEDLPRDAAMRSAGAMLRQIRESAGIDPVVVANALKITPQMLEALEQDRYQALPDLAFARSLASSICRNFSVDPGPVLSLMPQARPTELPTPASGINAPFHSAGERPAATLPRYITRPLTVVVALFLLGSLVLWLWPTLPIRLGEAPADVRTVRTDLPSGLDAEEHWLTEAPTDAAGQPQPTDEQPVETVLPAADEPMQAEAVEEALTSPAEMDDEDLGQDLGSAPVPESAAGDPAEAGAAGASDDDATAETVPVAEDDLVIEASGESWVSVSDATGRMLFNRLLEAGETARISGSRPLSVTIGRKEAVTVYVHGEPFDHRSMGNASVARFKVD